MTKDEVQKAYTETATRIGQLYSVVDQARREIRTLLQTLAGLSVRFEDLVKAEAAFATQSAPKAPQTPAAPDGVSG